jgi:sugar phosphate isomerase/epimerase
MVGGGALPLECSPFSFMSTRKIPVSVQLWSVRDHIKNDFAGTVAALAKFGYQGVETAGYGNLNANDAAAALKAAGLQVSGMHVGIDALRTSLNTVISDALTLGSRNIIVPSFPMALLATPAACAAVGEELACLGRRLAAHGIQLHFHNHAGELAKLEGRTIFERMLDAAPPAHLLCEADVYWVKVGGEDPAAFIRRQGQRISLIHLKDEKELGTGPVDFPSVFAAIDSVDSIEWQVVEVEKYNHDPLESVRLSLEQLKKWGRA